MSGSSRGGFSLVEILVALVILTAGILAMMSTTGFMTLQIQSADLDTERAMAVQEAIERVRATPFTALANQTSPLQIGRYEVVWTAQDSTENLKIVTITTTGPERTTSRVLNQNAAEITVYSVLRP